MKHQNVTLEVLNPALMEQAHGSVTLPLNATKNFGLHVWTTCLRIRQSEWSQAEWGREPGLEARTIWQ